LKKTNRLRFVASVVCVTLIIIVGISSVFIYNSTARIENTGISDEETDAFYEEETNSDDDSDESLYEDIGNHTGLHFTFPGRTLTSQVVPYDGVKRNIVCWGDSMTEGIGSSYAVLELDGESMDISYWSFPDALEYFTGITTYNFGVSGENSEEIAVRAGGIRLYTDRDVVVGYRHSAGLKVVNENGEKEYVQNYGGYGNQCNDYYGVVYIGGKMYTLNGSSFDNAIDLSLTRYTDTGLLDEYVVSEEDSSRTISAKEAMETYGVGYYEEFEFDADTCIVIPAGTLVTPKAAADHSDDILVIEIGSNGGWHNDYTELVAQIDSIIERFNNPYYIIVGDTDDPADSADANQGMLDAEGNTIGKSDTYWEAALREAYGEHFLNTREYLITNGLKDTGLLTTESDLQYFENGMISKKLRSDWTHFNSYGYYSQAKAIYLKGVELGYWE
jgi:hypothetical protein